MTYQQILAKQREQLKNETFRPFYMAPRVRANMQHIFERTSIHLMRDEGFSYQPEADTFIRIPSVHNMRFTEDELRQCFIQVMMAQLRKAEGEYPSMH